MTRDREQAPGDRAPTDDEAHLAALLAVLALVRADADPATARPVPGGAPRAAGEGLARWRLARLTALARTPDTAVPRARGGRAW